MSIKTINISSLHFEDSRFNRTVNKLRLCDNALPSPTLLVCRVCLALDVKMFDMKDFKLSEMFQNITGISLTVQNIKIIKPLNNQLRLRLSSKLLKPITIQDKFPSTCNVDIKDENNKRDKNDDELNDPGFNDPGFDNDGIADTDVLNDKSYPSDQEYVLSDKENYSSDDSLLLDKCTERATKTAKRMKQIEDPVEPKIHRRGKKLQNDDVNETLFTITDLTFEEQIAEIVKRQESSNYKNSYFKCTACYKGFLDEDAYKSHMARHTDQFGEHECKICKMHFKHRHVLNNHMTSHTQRYNCNKCTYVTKNRYTARLHARWHKGTKYPCPHCPEQFVHYSTYLSHLRIKHPSDFACEICGYSFVSIKGRELHKKLKHRLDNVQIPEDGPLCELCNVRFISSEAHKRHLSVSAKHNTDKDSRQPNQPKKDLKVLVKGKWMYTGSVWKAKDRIPCEQCGIQLEGSQAYHIHFRRMHPDKNRTNYPSMKNPCMCEVCGKMLQSSFHLKYHICVHKRERPFKCDSCDKSFRTKYRLVLHQRLHSQVRPSYPCTVCGKRFSENSNRQRHMVIHTGLKPYKCEICSKGFKTSAEKRVHVTYVHLKKPWPKRTRGKRKLETRQDQLAPQDQDMDMQARLRPQDGRNGACA